MNPTSRNTRTWSDEQLRVAVASHTSWRGVALGLAAGSTDGIRRPDSDWSVHSVDTTDSANASISTRSSYCQSPRVSGGTVAAATIVVQGGRPARLAWKRALVRRGGLDATATLPVAPPHRGW